MRLIKAAGDDYKALNCFNLACSHDILNIILYLDGESLRQLQISCKRFRLEKEVFEIAWRLLCLIRWNPKSMVLLQRILGVQSWSAVYERLAIKKSVPRGLYCERHNNVFGSGVNSHIASWILLGHSHDARPQRGEVNGRQCRVINVHVCLQSLEPSQPMKILPWNDSFLKIISKCQSSEFELGQITLLAKNGHRCDNYSTTTSAPVEVEASQVLIREVAPTIFLNLYEHVVFSVQVVCPVETKNEVDFLCIIDQIRITYNHRAANEFRSTDSIISTVIDDEDEIWKHYMQLPHDLVLLR